MKEQNFGFILHSTQVRGNPRNFLEKLVNTSISGTKYKILYILYIAMMHNLVYNEYNKFWKCIPGVFDTPDILNLHQFIWEAHIFMRMSSHHKQWKAET